MKKIVAILAVFTLLLSMGVFALADGGRDDGGIDLECRRVESAGGEAFVDVDMVIGSYLIGGPGMMDIGVYGKLIAPEQAVLIGNEVFVREVGVTDENEWRNMPGGASVNPWDDGRTYSVNYRAETSYDYNYSDWSGGPVNLELVVRVRFLVKDPGIIKFSICDMTAWGNWNNVYIGKDCALKVCKSISPDFIILCSVAILFFLGLIGLGYYMIFNGRRKKGGDDSDDSCYCSKEENECTEKRKYKRKHKREHKRQLEKNYYCGPRPL